MQSHPICQLNRKFNWRKCALNFDFSFWGVDLIFNARFKLFCSFPFFMSRRQIEKEPDVETRRGADELRQARRWKFYCRLRSRKKKRKVVFIDDENIGSFQGFLIILGLITLLVQWALPLTSWHRWQYFPKWSHETTINASHPMIPQRVELLRQWQINSVVAN